MKINKAELNISWISRKIFRFIDKKYPDYSFKKLSTKDVFDKIYSEGLWGKDERGLSTSGCGSIEKHIVEPYIEAVKKISFEKNIRSAVDLGCGDFSVGSQLFEAFESYKACDISQFIIERNKKKYKADNLEFLSLDLVRDSLPAAEILIVRQVLQHLSNEEVNKFVSKLNDNRVHKFLLLTEHLPSGNSFIPNRDKHHGPNTRVIWGSGVILHEDPFCLKYKSMREIISIASQVHGKQAEIRTILYEL